MRRQHDRLRTASIVPAVLIAKPNGAAGASAQRANFSQRTRVMSSSAPRAWTWSPLPFLVWQPARLLRQPPAFSVRYRTPAEKGPL